MILAHNLCSNNYGGALNTAPGGYILGAYCTTLRHAWTNLEEPDWLKDNVNVDFTRLPLSAQRRTVPIDDVGRRNDAAQRIDRQTPLTLRQKPEPDVT